LGKEECTDEVIEKSTDFRCWPKRTLIQRPLMSAFVAKQTQSRRQADVAF
jgi:hypothetical protein